jgi:hypothetical protein
MTAFLFFGYPSIFFLFHLLLGMAAAVRILRVEKKNKNEGKFWQTKK